MGESVNLSLIACRFCLAKQNLCDIFKVRNKKFSVSYPDMSKQCLDIDVLKGDGLPPWLCIKCSNKLNSFHRFKLKCLKNIESLLKYDKKEINIKIENECNETMSNTKAEQSTFYDYEQPINEKQIYEQPMGVTESITILKDVKQNEYSLITNNTYLEDEEVGVTYDIKIENETEIENFILSVKPNDSEDEIKDEVDQADELMLKKFEMFLPKLKEDQTNCPFCMREYKKHWELLDHIKYKHFKIKHYCDICKQYFNYETKHKKTHIQKKWMQCKRCIINFSSKMQYIEHIKKIHNRTGPYKCECGEIFDRKVVFKKHRFLVHQYKNYMCHYCSRGYTRKSRLQQHIQEHIDGKVFRKLPVQEKSEAPTLIEDIPIINEKCRVCPICNKNFDRHAYLMEHIHTLHLGQKYFCKICKKTYASESRHIQRRHQPEAYWRQCKTCHKKFPRMDMFYKHMYQIHGVVVEKQCRHICHCGKQFNVIAEFRKHKYKIHGQTDYVCHICSKGFLKKDRMKDHILMVHSSDKTFHCNICNKGFKCQDTLRKHKKLHRPHGDFVCDHCGKSFGFKSYLRAHITSHDPKWKLHACKFCGKKFRRTDHRNTHQRLVHKMEPTLLYL